MSREELERLRDIKDAIFAIRSHLAASGPPSNDSMLHDALLFQLVVVGEAVKNTSPETRASEPDVPWQAIAGLRDLIAHENFRIDIDRTLAVVEGDLPRLEAAIDRLLSQ